MFSYLSSLTILDIILCAVVGELDGLSRGVKDKYYDSMEHAEMVRSGARHAISFLEREFESRNGHLKALTTEGTTLDTITFRSESKKDVVSLSFVLQ